MNLFEHTIQFLSEKATRINEGVSNSKTAMMHAVMESYYNNPGWGTKNLKTCILRHTAVSRIVTTILALVEIKAHTNIDNELELEEQVNNYLDGEVKLIQRRPLNYNFIHPFYGYPLFQEKLISKLTSDEEYEKISFIKATISDTQEKGEW